MSIALKFITIFSISSLGYLIGQNPFTILTGKVLTEELSAKEGEPIKNAKVVLLTPDGSITETKSDSGGNYSFRIPNNNVDSVMMRVGCDKMTQTNKMLSRESFLGTRTIKIGLTEDDTLIFNFYLKKIIACAGFYPNIRFSFNSTKLINDSLEEIFSENAINTVYQILVDNPTIVLEIASYSDNGEKYGISNKRTAMIISNLVKKGINSKRLVGKGYCLNHPYVSDKAIKQVNTVKEKERLHQENRRADIRILRFDFREN